MSFKDERCKVCEEPITTSLKFKYDCACERKEELSYKKRKVNSRFHVSLEEYNRMRNFRAGRPN